MNKFTTFPAAAMFAGFSLNATARCPSSAALDCSAREAPTGQILNLVGPIVSQILPLVDGL